MQIQILGWSPRFCISNQLMVGASGVDLWTTLLSSQGLADSVDLL